MSSKKSTVAALGRASEIGQELKRIHDTAGLHKLSADAWRAQSLELGQFKDAAELEALRGKLGPYLAREIDHRARQWRDGNQDRPAVWAGFSDGDGSMAPSYAERVASGVTVEQASALVGWTVVEVSPEEHFGTLGDFSELDAMREPLLDELRQLDADLAGTVLVKDLVPSRGQWCVPAGAAGLVLVTEESRDRLASATAEAIASGLRLAA